jgi:hypothetical protein
LVASGIAAVAVCIMLPHCNLALLLLLWELSLCGCDARMATSAL